MISRRMAIGATLVCLAVAFGGLMIALQQRLAACDLTPLIAPQLLANPDWAAGNQVVPDGWEVVTASGARLRGPAIDGEGFDLDGNGRAMQLFGIANALTSPTVAVQANQPYCFRVFALGDDESGSAPRGQLRFHWFAADGSALPSDTSQWQPVVYWQPDLQNWSRLQAAFRAPERAVTLRVSVQLSSDDRVYLDLPHLLRGGNPPAPLSAEPNLPTPLPWPNGRAAAVAFTFDWETAMGGLIHSRSVDDPFTDQDPLLRALRMREGITTTIALFAPYGVRATYYANGYNFLAGNREARTFMGDPTFTWANQANGWRTDRWTTTPWFSDDPHGTLVSHPEWYFADLIAPLRDAGHEIQSHTFSHLYVGLADLAEWNADLAEWNALATPFGLAPARSLAFPWSSSAGMSEAQWQALAAAGVRSVTRLSDQDRSNLFAQDARGMVLEPRCTPVPGHKQILACPDFYLTVERAALAAEQIERAVAAGGMIDFWAHTEEVVGPEQIAAWEAVVRRVAEDARLWHAPLSEIAARQQAVAGLQINAAGGDASSGYRYTISNLSATALPGLTLDVPFALERAAVMGDPLEPNRLRGRQIDLDLAANATVEMTVWPTP